MKPGAVVRCEVGAGELVNRVTNHSGQTGNANGWAILPAGGRLAALTLAGDDNRGFDGHAIGWSLDPGARIAGPPVAATSTSVAWQATVRDLRPAPLRGQPLVVRAWVEFYDEVGNVLYGGAPKPDPVTIGGDEPHVITSASTLAAINYQYAGAAATARACMIITKPDGSDPWPADTTYSFLIGRLMVVQALASYSATAVDCPIANVPFSDTGLVWQDILGSSINVSIDRGLTQDGVADRLEVGRATVTIRDATLDPDRSGRLRKGTPLRVMAKRGDDWAPLFTGEISEVSATYPQRKGRGALRPIVTVHADDPVAALGRVRQVHNYAGNLAEKVNALMAPYAGPYTSPGSGISTTPVTFEENGMLVNQLQRAVNTFTGGKMWMGADGVLNVAEFTDPAPAVMLTDNDGTPQLRNVVTNPSYEVAVGGAPTGCTMSRSTLWAATGASSLLLTSTGGTGRRTYRPPTESGTPGFIAGSVEWGYGIAGVRVTVKAAQACKAYLVMHHPDGTGGWSSAAISAGGTATLDRPAATLFAEGLTVELVIGAYTSTSPDDTNTLVGDLAWIDGWCLYDSGDTATGPNPQWIGPSTQTDPDTGLEVTTPGSWVFFDAWYFDGANGGTWTGTPHASASLFAPVTSYTDIEPVFGLEGVVNSLSIARNVAAEVEGRKVYGPFVASSSVAEWGTEADTLETVDPASAYTLAGDLLRRNALPSVFPRTITVNARHVIGTGLPWAEPYTSAVVVLSDSSISRPVYLLGATHTITPERWMITYRCRTVDAMPDPGLNVNTPSAGPTAGPVDLIAPTNRQDTGKITTGFSSKSAAFTLVDTSGNHLGSYWRKHDGMVEGAFILRNWSGATFTLPASFNVAGVTGVPLPSHEVPVVWRVSGGDGGSGTLTPGGNVWLGTSGTATIPYHGILRVAMIPWTV